MLTGCTSSGKATESPGHPNSRFCGARQSAFSRPIRSRSSNEACNIPLLVHPVSIELSVDNNDTYLVKGQRAGQVVWQTELTPRQNGGGMAVHRLSVPDAIRQAGLESLEIRPTIGDGRFSLG